MLKRFLHVLLALTLLMLTGCGGDPSGSDTPSQPVTEAPTEAPTETPTEEPQAPTLPQSCNAQFDFVADGIYNYCPSIMQVDENTAYIYYCTNRSYYNVVDYVGSRKGTRQEDGTWKSDEAYEIGASDEFKVRQGKAWTENYGMNDDGTPAYNGANVTLTKLGVEAGTYYIVFDATTGQISVVAA